MTVIVGNRGTRSMRFRDFMELYDNWNGTTRINDDNLNMIVEGNTAKIVEERTDLYDMEVVTFGFYDDELTVRVK